MGVAPGSDLDGGPADSANVELLALPAGDRQEEQPELPELPDWSPFRGVVAVRAGSGLAGPEVLLLRAETEE
jgi:hypothetical protein